MNIDINVFIISSHYFTGIPNPQGRNKFITHAEVTPELKPKVHKNNEVTGKVNDGAEISDSLQHDVIEKDCKNGRIFINQMQSIKRDQSFDDCYKIPRRDEQDER